MISTSHGTPYSRLVQSLFVLLLAGLVSCSSGTYHRGSTTYVPGTADVRQPNIKHIPIRNFEGFRIAGPDSDVVPDFWDEMLITKKKLGTFELFELRYHDLVVYDAAKSGACDAVLNSFRIWAKRRNLEADFVTFWENK